MYNTGLLRINQISAPAKKGKYNKRSFKIKKYIDIFDGREKEVIVGRFGID
ncbi:RNA polymerase sigma-K factor [Bacillus licheniformis]|nr:RNA polymerase sigma-K factor [Bacillus licheniformis]